MGCWIFMTCMCLLVPGILIAFGGICKDKAPKDINHIYGYRTSMSMKNRDTWEFANTLWGKLAWKWGLWMLVGSAAALLAVIFAGENVVYIVGSVVCCLQIVIVLATIPIVERALRKEFDKDGNRRN